MIGLIWTIVLLLRELRRLVVNRVLFFSLKVFTGLSKCEWNWRVSCSTNFNQNINLRKLYDKVINKSWNNIAKVSEISAHYIRVYIRTMYNDLCKNSHIHSLLMFNLAIYTRERFISYRNLRDFCLRLYGINLHISGISFYYPCLYFYFMNSLWNSKPFYKAIYKRHLYKANNICI